MKFLKNIPLKERTKLKANIEKLKELHIKQAELLTEMFLTPHEHIIQKSNLVLTNHCSVDEYLNTLDKARTQIKEVMTFCCLNNKTEEKK